jgi:hypothetical protein
MEAILRRLNDRDPLIQLAHVKTALQALLSGQSISVDDQFVPQAIREQLDLILNSPPALEQLGPNGIVDPAELQRAWLAISEDDRKVFMRFIFGEQPVTRDRAEQYASVRWNLIQLIRMPHEFYGLDDEALEELLQLRVYTMRSMTADAHQVLPQLTLTSMRLLEQWLTREGHPELNTDWSTSELRKKSKKKKKS